MTNPCIICVAITGSLPRKAHNPAVPISITEQVESTHAAFEAGASIVHAHVRDDDGKPPRMPTKTPHMPMFAPVTGPRLTPEEAPGKPADWTPHRPDRPAGRKHIPFRLETKYTPAGDQPAAIAGRAYNLIAYGPDHILSRGALGTESSVAALTMDDLRAYLDKHLAKTAGVLGKPDDERATFRRRDLYGRRRLVVFAAGQGEGRDERERASEVAHQRAP